MSGNRIAELLKRTYPTCWKASQLRLHLSKAILEIERLQRVVDAEQTRRIEREHGRKPDQS